MRQQVKQANWQSSAHSARIAVACLALGAGLMYMFDPYRGARRRALVRDKAIHIRKQTGRTLAKTAEYTRGWMSGWIAQARSLWTREHVSDRRLHDRVRAALGRAVSHPGPVEVDVHKGIVTLRGPVLEDEADNLFTTIRNVRGVRDVISRVDIFHQSGDIPGLQGEGIRPGMRAAFARRHWSPASRLLTGTTGAAILLWSLRRNGLTRLAGGILGGSLLTRAATPRRRAGITPSLRRVS